MPARVQWTHPAWASDQPRLYLPSDRCFPSALRGEAWSGGATCDRGCDWSRDWKFAFSCCCSENQFSVIVLVFFFPSLLWHRLAAKKRRQHRSWHFFGHVQKSGGLRCASSLWEEPRVAERWLPSLVPPQPWSFGHGGYLLASVVWFV